MEVVAFQFLLIFRKAAVGELKNDGLMEVYRHIREVDVNAEGVKGAKNFFEAKVVLHSFHAVHSAGVVFVYSLSILFAKRFHKSVIVLLYCQKAVARMSSLIIGEL